MDKFFCVFMFGRILCLFITFCVVSEIMYSDSIKWIEIIDEKAIPKTTLLGKPFLYFVLSFL